MPEYASDLAAVYAAEAESVTVDGTAVEAFFNTGYGEVYGVSGNQIALRCITSTVSAVAVGDAAVRGAVNYVVRGIEQIAPDGLETLLILERA